MRLNERLSALKAQKRAASSGNTLVERVSRLRPGCGSGSTVGPVDEAGLAGRLGGRLIGPGVILLEREHRLARCQGRFSLGCSNRQLENLPGGEGLEPERLLFLDTETTGLSGGSGTLVFLLGLARIREAVLLSRQYLLTRFYGEPAMLEAAAGWIEAGDTLVTYNGKSFDLPLLSTRFRMAGVSDAFAGYRHLDLLHPLRRAYAPSWPDCRLATAERQLLGFQRRDDLPGAQAPAAWLDWVRQGDMERVPAVCRHNRWDLLSLAALIPALSRAYQDSAAAGADPLAIARFLLARNRGDDALNLLLKQRHRLQPNGELELARLLKQRGRWDEVIAIWSRQARNGCVSARESLAKYYEHVAHDYPRALTHARKLSDAPLSDHRCSRLRRKMRQPGLPLFERSSVF